MNCNKFFIITMSYSIMISKNLIFSSIIVASLLITEFSNTNLFAELIDYQTKIIPICNSIGIEKSIIQMNICR